jgi:hypothetical protein
VGGYTGRVAVRLERCAGGGAGGVVDDGVVIVMIPFYFLYI